MKKSKFYTLGISLLFMGLYAHVLFKLYKYTHNLHPFILGDWLINFEGEQFRRRGLSGEFFFLIQDITGFSLPDIVFSVQMLFIAIFLFFTLLLVVKNSSKEALYPIVFLLPTTLLFWINDSFSVGRKEIMLLATFSVSVYLLSINKIKTSVIIALGVWLGICCLFHELVLFYLPYFIFLLILAKKNTISNYLFLLLPSIICVLCLLFFGDMQFSNGKTMDILSQRGVINMSDALINFKEAKILSTNIKRTVTYIYPLLFSLLLIFVYELIYKKKITVVYLFILALLFSLPLFLKATDWGRWIFIHSVLSVLLLSVIKSRTIHTYIHTGLRIIIVLLFVIGLMFRMVHVDNGVAPSFLGIKIEKLYNKIIQ